MPNNLYFKNTNSAKKKKINSKVLFKFFFDPAIIMCAIVCIVSLCAGAYKSYLFPLFTNGLNISNVDISNYFVIASALVFIFSPSLDKITNKFDHWNNVLSYLFILGFIFCLFTTNQTVIWAFAAFFLSCIFQKSLNAEWKVLWPRKCKKQNIDPAQLQPVFSAIDSFGLCIRPVILGSFVAFGSAGSCVALGIVCAVTGILFLIFTRKSSIVSLQK